ncbi:hypothetical protein SDC9_118672 [bioreactor metagenome]|uniref:Uncharacterized protein n=1 Tax=bioreactor metagenome TaxID=1076179 RepID=A0A645C251_9ZZZZ
MSGLIFCIRPFRRNLNFHQSVNAFIHGSVIHLLNVFSLSAIRLVDRILQQTDRLALRKNAGQLKKGGLHHHIDAVTKTDFRSNFQSIYDIEPDAVLCQIAL